jgi:hypothetical protein
MVFLTAKAKLIAMVSVVLLLYVSVDQRTGDAMTTKQNYERCKHWQAKVDPSIKLTKSDNEASNASEEEILEGIECLLELEGRTSLSNFSSATVGYNLSQRFAAPSIEVAALFYASYLFQQKWQHAQAMILMDKRGKKNTKESIRRAYKAYRLWLKEIKDIGLEKARKQGLDPLAGTKIRWY